MNKTFEIFVIDVPTLIKIKAVAGKGFKTEEACVMVIEHTLRKMSAEAMECVCRDCTTLMDNRFTIPRAFAVCVPMFPVPGDDAIACAVCDSCIDRPDLLERMTEAMRELFPSFELAQPGERRQ
jgi:hypothetical protein